MLAVTSILLLEGVEVDQAGLFVRKESEGNVVFRVGFCEEVVEDGPIVDVDAILLATVGDGEEDCVLFALDFVLFRCKQRIYGARKCTRQALDPT